MKSWSAAHQALAERVRGAYLDEWRDIRLMCPRGHYVCHVTIGVPVVEDRAAAPLWLWPHASNQPATGYMTSDALKLAWHHSSQTTGVTVRCGRKRCTYRGRHDMFRLAVEAGAAALAGHAEFVLTS